MKIKIFNREICACALLDTNSLCAKSSAEMEKTMKKALIVAAALVGIIAMRMILSVALSEQIAEVFSRVSLSFLFICTLFKFKPKTTNL